MYNRRVAFAAPEIDATIRVICDAIVDQIGNERWHNNVRMAYVVTTIVPVRVYYGYDEDAVRSVPFIVRYDVFTEAREKYFFFPGIAN